MLGLHDEIIKTPKTYLTKTDDGVLAKAYDQIGKREKAVETSTKGIDVSMGHGHPSMANEYRMTLDLDFAD